MSIHYVMYAHITTIKLVELKKQNFFTYRVSISKEGMHEKCDRGNDTQWHHG